MGRLLFRDIVWFFTIPRRRTEPPGVSGLGLPILMLMLMAI